MVEITMSYEGDLHVAAAHGPSGATLDTDAPADNGGLGRTYSPTDLLAASLGSCILTTAALVARRDGFSIDGATARVEKHMTASPPRRVERLVVEIKVPAGLTPEQTAAVERAAKGCPVTRSLHPDTAIDLSVSPQD